MTPAARRAEMAGNIAVLRALPPCELAERAREITGYQDTEVTCWRCHADLSGASIVIWSYAMTAPPDVPGGFQIGFLCEYRFRFPDVIDADDRDWVLTAWSDDPEWYFTLPDCEAGARETAEIMAARRYGPDDGPAAEWEFFFDWEGVPC